MKRLIQLFVLSIIIPLSIIAQDDAEFIEFIPDEILNPIQEKEEKLYKNLPDYIGGQPLSAVVEKSNIWNQGSLKVCFIGGNKDVHKVIAETASTWSKHGRVTFDFGQSRDGVFRQCTTKDTSHIRIGFKYPGYWSVLGTKSLKVYKGDPTMNFYKYDKRLPSDAQSTILHEFGHALGFEHEHQSSQAKCDFEWDKIYSHYAKAPNNWNKKQVDQNLKAVQEGGKVYTAHDAKSIMHYQFPSFFFKKGVLSNCFTTKNSILSKEDKQMMAKIYPADKKQYVESRREIAGEIRMLQNHLVDQGEADFDEYAEEFIDEMGSYFEDEFSENTTYVIGVEGLNVPEDEFYEITDFLFEEEYTILFEDNYSDNDSADWLEEQSTVIYYYPENQDKALELAELMQTLTGEEFSIFFDDIDSIDPMNDEEEEYFIDLENEIIIQYIK